jgi:beta-glucosidase
MLSSSNFLSLRNRIPDKFIFGAATSSWQIEGDSAGRGRSIWDDFADATGNIKDGTKADPACRHIEFYKEDVRLLSELGVDAYRFSFSWPRVMPGGRSKSESGLDFYDRLIDELLDKNIAPVATLYHWDLPSELQEIGGWENPDIFEDFANYTRVLAEKFADRISMWATFNEPWVSAFLGYATKIHAPGLGEPSAGFRSAFNLMVAHGFAMDVLREQKAKQPGIVLNLTNVIAEDDSVREVADYVDELQNKFWLDLLAGRGISKSLIEKTKSITDWDFVDEQQLLKVAQPIDWLGINYYTPFRIKSAENDSQSGAVGQDFSLFPGAPGGAAMNPLEPKTQMGWEIHPASFTETLLQTNQRLPGIPIYITENGGAFPDPIQGERVEDDDRVQYFLSHISAVIDAVDQGVDVRGYFAWSLMDNIEWAEGMAQKFGIIHVNPETQKRTPKLSYNVLRDLFSKN